uniref:Ubiquitin like domain containing CTD phosphatase 1 n=1 Tax=Pavo cristatus TaxID=9049 RepID=A0A8C9EU52_PAVCR
LWISDSLKWPFHTHSCFQTLTEQNMLLLSQKAKSLASVFSEDVLGPPPDNDDVINDFDIEEEVVEVENREENLLKISRRVKEYKVEILNPPREGKKLLVLDVDYTLFGETLCNLWGWFKRAVSLPVHVSSCLIYKYTSVILACVFGYKQSELGVSTNANYKITFMLDSAAMITVHTPRRGLIDVKPLGVIWGKFSEYYSKKNTIMFDDIGRNFLMNPQNGLKVTLTANFIYYFFLYNLSSTFSYFLLYIKVRLFLTSKDAYFIVPFLFRLPFGWTSPSLIVVLKH